MPKFHGMIAQRLHLPDCRHHSRDEGVVDRSTKHSKGRRILSANLQSLVDATQDSTQRPRPGDSKGRIVPCLLEHHVPERFGLRSEEHTSELQSLMRISYAVFCLKK